MQPTKFDELTKALADTRSRRDALKLIATASIGGLFGLGGVRTAFGNKIKCHGNTPNSDCAHWCAAVFGPNTSAASRCTSDAAHGRGLCCQCGSTTSPSSICCVRNTSGYCNGTSAATCCASGQHCCNGTCSQCCANTDCTNGNTCGSNHTCVCGSGAGCTGTDTCVAGSCCPAGQVCGNTCCSSDQTCNSGTCCIADNGSCTSDGDCCSNICDSTTMTCVACIPSGDSGCGSDGDCCSGQTCCAGLCTNTNTDPNNCGTCGNICPTPSHGASVLCSSGTCGFTCQNGYTPQNGQCVPVNQCANPAMGCTTCQSCNCSPSGTGCCFQTAEGGTACASGGVNGPCASSSQCPSGQLCVVNTCTLSGLCVPVCG